MNNDTFFSHVRRSVFGGHMTQEQVDGVLIDLAACRRHGVTDTDAVAYVLATDAHETGERMQPVRETFATSDEQAVARLNRAFSTGRLPWVKKPYWHRDRNDQHAFGRGKVQLTHADNYEKADEELGLGGALVKDYNKALELEIATDILVLGMRDGWFTGKKLRDKFGPGDDPLGDSIEARRIVNGTDRATHIARIAQKFEKALRDAGWGEDQDQDMPREQQRLMRGRKPSQQSTTRRQRERPSSEPLNTTGRINARLSERDKRNIQTLLKRWGAYTGLIDGKFGPETKAAIINFKTYKRFTEPDGSVNDDITWEVWEALKEPGRLGRFSERNKTTVEDLAPRSKSIRDAQAGRTVTTGGVSVLVIWNAIQQWLPEARAFFQDWGPTISIIIGLALVGFVWVNYGDIIKRKLQEFKEGRYTPATSDKDIGDADNADLDADPDDLDLDTNREDLREPTA